MRIAQVAPLTESVPPRTYGGTERVVSYLTEELVRMGHEVTLFASGDSMTEADLEAIWPCALRFDATLRDGMAPIMLQLERLIQRAHEFDILHCHLDYWPFSLLSRQATPHMTTLHGRLDLPELTRIFEIFPDVPVVSISDSQRRPLSDANFIGTVHHGLPPSLLTPQGGPRDYLAFLGRICPEKSPDRAIRIARAAGKKLKIAAKIDRVDRAYFETQIRPMIDGEQIELIGEITDAEKPDFLSHAEALLLPIDWPEPFGLVMIEAMACGTPTIAFPAGSVPEVIDHGVTGFIVPDEAQAVAALNHLEVFSQDRIRDVFEARFTARRMAEDYLALYRRIALRTRPALRVVT
ncbi:MAG TPA: glycosyltransferase family 4 protein [Rhodopila sp.]|uniref:glycosyltransferase family 4 protein n=1 Tax=Rhodopila sp. TaxID=2480087 RepID=UPI002B9F7E09|nr:glycosyltransferase family 4 protein [Rhodopila sp.]HVY14157.1 glycosyltransferase family 4 protein [Rhodopila sp.]